MVRRERRRWIRERPPSNRALILRVAFYTLVLVAVLVFQDAIGRAGSGCMALFQ